MLKCVTKQWHLEDEQPFMCVDLNAFIVYSILNCLNKFRIVKPLILTCLQNHGHLRVHVSKRL